MASVSIYCDNKLVEETKILLQFYVLEGPAGKLFWYEKDPNPSIGGICRIWIRSIPSDPDILFILPDWQLIIDGRPMKRQFYSKFTSIEGKTIELIYRDYKFVFKLFNTP